MLTHGASLLMVVGRIHCRDTHVVHVEILRALVITRDLKTDNATAPTNSLKLARPYATERIWSSNVQ